MNSLDDTLHRVLARHLGRGLPIRAASSIAPDPENSFGIATLKIVTEEHIQAIAFGRLDREPAVIVRLNPIGRDVNDLLPFAEFLIDRVEQALTDGGEFRVWIPHSAVLESLDVLGHRYWRNQSAPHEIVRMGEICRIIAHEATYPGQQIVAEAASLLSGHAVTGLSPVEEGHLGALLAWFDDEIQDPLTEARMRIRIPASGVLPNTPDFPVDDRVDKLRREMKNASPRRRAYLQSEIEVTIREWVLREWNLLVDARRAFNGLKLSTRGTESLTKQSRERVVWALEHGHFPARQPERLAKLLGDMEACQGQVERASLIADPVVRAQKRSSGDVLDGVVSAVRQAAVRRMPCAIDVQSSQNVIRLRLDDKVEVIGTNVTGVVRSLESIPEGGTKVTLEITKGVRTTEVLTRGARLEVMKEGYGGGGSRALKLARDREPWMFYQDVAPNLPPTRDNPGSALAQAAKVRLR